MNQWSQKYKTNFELLPRFNKTWATLVLTTGREVLSLIPLHNEPIRCSCKWSPLRLDSYNSCQLRSKDLLALWESDPMIGLCRLLVLSCFCAQITRQLGGFWWFLDRELLYIQTCTRYISESAITVSIQLLSINICHLHPFSSLTTYFQPTKTLTLEVILPRLLVTHRFFWDLTIT